MYMVPQRFNQMVGKENSFSLVYPFVTGKTVFEEKVIIEKIRKMPIVITTDIIFFL